jgi:NAD kinase
MMPATERRIVLVTRRTRLDDLVARFNTELQARFYVEHLGADFSDYKAEDETYKRQVALAQGRLAAIGRLHSIERSFVPNYVFGPDDIVVALGQDGLVVNVLKYLTAQPLVGVNPEPKRWEGVLLPFSVAALKTVIPDVVRGARPIREVTLAVAELNTGARLFAVNDLFVGTKTHGSARYRIQIGRHSEEHSSSGIIVSTGLGSTGWLRSVIAGATGIARQLGEAAPARGSDRRWPWDARRLVFSVREPWPSKTTAAQITFGEVNERQALRLLSLMPERGVIFSDGIEEDFLEFNSGTAARIKVAERRGRLVM